MRSIGVRELRQNASKWLDRVQAGESFEITDRGRPVANLVPVRQSEWDTLIASGAVTHKTRDLLDIRPVRAPERPPLTTLLAEDRQDER